jgi:hypothetical protein
MDKRTLYSALATSFLTLPNGDEVVQVTRDSLVDKPMAGDFLSSSVIEEKPYGKHERFRKLSLRFQKLTLILDVVNDYKSNRQFVNSFQIVS